MIPEEMKDQVEELLSKMTFKEKLAQLQCMQLGRCTLSESVAQFPHGVGQTTVFGGKPTAEENMKFGKEIQEEASAVFSLPPIMHGEAVTGLNAGEATIFPSAIGLGATWNPELIWEIADVIRKQMLSIGTRQALSPVMDVARDPRWGRVGETYGEDPTLCAAMSVAFTKGLQSDSLKDGVIATGKHFLGYGNAEGGLNMAANPIAPRELREVYAKPFQAAISEGGLFGLMNSYGTVDGELVITSRNLLHNLLREEMGFEGIVVSDYMSIEKAVDLCLCSSGEEGGEAALKAGLDVELPQPFGYTDDLLEKVISGKLSEELIDRSVRRVLTAKLLLGLPENPYPREELLEQAYDRELTKKVSLRAAREATVLLKNNGVLPLKKKAQKIAVIGAHGDSLRLMFGCYTFPATLDMLLSGSMRDVAGLENVSEKKQDSVTEESYYPGSRVRKESEKVTDILQKLYGERTPTILRAIREKCPDAEVRYAYGCPFVGDDRSGFQEAIELAKDSDVVILTLGGKYGWGNNCTTGEGIDTDRIGLPGIQEELAQAVCETGRPTIMVHLDTKPLSSVYLLENCGAVLEYWFPGDTGGEALADILFGDYNPSGRLPMTAPRTEGQIPIYSSHRRGSGYSKVLGMTLCKYVEGEKQPLGYFGEGRSYTTFAYSNLTVTPEAASDGNITVTCHVENTGEMDGEEVIQLYVSDEKASMIRPVKELAGFARVRLKVGERKEIGFTMKVTQFAFLDKDMNWVVEEGKMKVMVGASSEDIRLTGTFFIRDTAQIDCKTRGFFSRVEERILV